jgi:nucleoid DNA-binding protein
MKPKDLAQTVAKKTGQSRAKAQDEIDILVHRILRSLREGKEVKLPGVGKLVGLPAKTRHAR